MSASGVSGGNRPTSAAPQETTTALPFRETLIEKAQLNECDKIDLNFLGSIQGDSENVIFFSYPECKIIAADANILTGVPFLARQEDGVTLKDMMGASIEDFFPSHIFNRVQDVVQRMIKTVCVRDFIFFRDNGTFYTLSVSTTLLDHSIIGIEIETLDSDSASESFHSTLTFWDMQWIIMCAEKTPPKWHATPSSNSWASTIEEWCIASTMTCQEK